MAAFISNHIKKTLLDILAAQDLRVLLVDATFDGAPAAQFLGDITTLGELTGTGYVRKALTGKVNAIDAVNNRSELDSDDLTWVAINAGTAAGYVLYQHVTNDADSPFLGFSDSGGFPLVTNGGDITINVSVEGLLQLT